MAERSNKMLWFVLVVLVLVVGVSIGYGLNQSRSIQTQLLDAGDDFGAGDNPSDVKGLNGDTLGDIPADDQDLSFMFPDKTQSKEMSAIINDIAESMYCIYNEDTTGKVFESVTCVPENASELLTLFGVSDGKCNNAQCGVFGCYVDPDCKYGPGDTVVIELDDPSDPTNDILLLDCEYAGIPECDESSMACPWVSRIVCVEESEGISS